MLSLGIKNNGYPEWFYLMELKFQCEMLKSAHARLVDYSSTEVSKPQNAIFMQPDLAMNVIGDCTQLLSAMAMISKLMFPNGNPSEGRHVISHRLNKLLGDIDFPILQSRTVRNHFEHIDERLERMIRENPDAEICQIHVSRDEPRFPIVLRRFDPVEVSISFLGDKLLLKDCIEEVERLERAILKVTSLTSGQRLPPCVPTQIK